MTRRDAAHRGGAVRRAKRPEDDQARQNERPERRYHVDTMPGVIGQWPSAVHTDQQKTALNTFEIADAANRQECSALSKYLRHRSNRKVIRLGHLTIFLPNSTRTETNITVMPTASHYDVTGL